MKNFLRFHIVGATFIFWTLAFLAPYFPYQNLTKNREALLALIASFGFLSPMGVLIHEISITVIFCLPGIFLQLFKKVTPIAHEIVPDGGSPFDKKHTLSKAFLQKDDTEGFDIQYIREEISNRYSYYYVRIDNGIMAPLWGFVISSIILITSSLLNLSFFKSGDLSFYICRSIVPIIFAAIIGLALVWYVPRLLIEIYELESFLLKDPKFEESYSQRLKAEAQTARSHP